MSTTVHVSNISSETSEHEVREFFSFCGKITSLSVTPSSGDPNSPKSATVTFEKEAAARTALLLNETNLGSSTIAVKAAEGLDQLASGKGPTPGEAVGKDDGELRQEDKPRSRILAEYIAQGYGVGDKALQRAIELDKQHGFSNRFTAALSNFDNRVKASERAKSANTAYGITDRAQAGFRGLQSYFEKAMNTPTGHRVRTFYTQTEKQVLDIHNEARRLAELHKQEQGSGGDVKAADAPGAESSVAGQGQSATGPAADVAAAAHLQPLGSNMPHESTGPAPEYTADTKIAPTGDDLAGRSA